ncbi:LysR family transcriptional regulator [Sphingomonas sp. AP4-R1]|uniref:LysR family transcriptional regulator n=1 Tax=Sphingomonas sp. AP4-R1 TaxID=2735134 RepID=UPI0014938C0D|nr:LysR family transcriptional regulator [Sphingomonas sp. AP4-R1]QJU59175.1 LysR family transcriptional regulator [Sphingomonas sp. AP4-R1]
MQWDDLRVLLAVARHGLIAKAAAELKADPTTISRRIQRLERDMGQTLVERLSSGPRLTAAGRQIARKAAAMEAASAEVLGQTHQPSLVRVSVSEGFGTWFMAHHLADFARTHPTIEVELVATSGFLNPSRRETDIAILLAKPRRGPLATRKLTDYALQLFASRALVGDGTRIADIAALQRESLIGYIPDLIYAPELDYLDEIGSGLHAALRSNSINAQYRFIAAGAGIGVLPCFIGNADPSLVAVLPEIVINRSFWLSIHLDVRQRPHVRIFTDWLAETIGINRAKLMPVTPAGSPRSER